MEAEGFLEVKLVVSRQGAVQHMEVDFPTDVPVTALKAELALLVSALNTKTLVFPAGLQGQ